MERIIDVKGLKKSYGSLEAVKGIDFHMEKGQLFAFLGPNGAGKSTTIDIITTFLKPNSGSVHIDGFQLGKEDDEIRKSIGAVFQDNLLDKKLSVRENLMTRGSLYGLHGESLKKAVEHTLTITELQDIANRKYGKLSGGQRRRADIARSLIHTPKLLFLDEPTTGLDPQTRAMLWNVILKLQKEEGMSIFLTTHYMEEAADADYVVVIDHGCISAQGTPVQLKERYAHDTLRIYPHHLDYVQTILKDLSITYEFNKDALDITLANTMDAIPIINKVKDEIAGFEVLHGTLDDAFLGIIGRELS